MSGEDAGVYQTIYLHPDAPPKPATGRACNGCGVCCASEPCPAGVLVSRRVSGPCAALAWTTEGAMYRCGLITRPAAYLPARLRRLAPLLARLARRFVSAGSGCDSSVRIEPLQGRS